MADQTRIYKTLRAFPHHGRVIEAGREIWLYPSQAKYLLGTHLEEAGKTAPASKARKTKGEQ